MRTLQVILPLAASAILLSILGCNANRSGTAAARPAPEPYISPLAVRARPIEPAAEPVPLEPVAPAAPVAATNARGYRQADSVAANSNAATVDSADYYRSYQRSKQMAQTAAPVPSAAAPQFQAVAQPGQLQGYTVLVAQPVAQTQNYTVFLAQPLIQTPGIQAQTVAQAANYAPAQFQVRPVPPELIAQIPELATLQTRPVAAPRANWYTPQTVAQAAAQPQSLPTLPAKPTRPFVKEPDYILPELQPLPNAPTYDTAYATYYAAQPAAPAQVSTATAAQPSAQHPGMAPLPPELVAQLPAFPPSAPSSGWSYVEPPADCPPGVCPPLPPASTVCGPGECFTLTPEAASVGPQLFVPGAIGFEPTTSATATLSQLPSPSAAMAPQVIVQSAGSSEPFESEALQAIGSTPTATAIIVAESPAPVAAAAPAAPIVSTPTVSVETASKAAEAATGGATAEVVPHLPNGGEMDKAIDAMLEQEKKAEAVAEAVAESSSRATLPQVELPPMLK